MVDRRKTDSSINASVLYRNLSNIAHHVPERDFSRNQRDFTPPNMTDS